MRALFLILIQFLLLVQFCSAQTALTAGDIAITGFNMDATKGWSFVLLVPVDAGTEIKFTDNGWRSTNVFRTGEGVVTWTAPAGGLTCGTEISIEDNSPYTTSTGTVAETSGGGPNLSASSGDQILAYQGLDASPTFIYAINSETAGSAWQADATTANNSALPLGLTDGTNAIGLAEIDCSVYDCSTVTGSQAVLLAAISNTANWGGTNTGPLTLPSCNFICSSSSISTGAVAGSPFCITSSTGASVSVDFTSTGTFNSGNIYTAQLSDALGSFASPTDIGTLASTANSGTIAASIPAGTVGGSSYRIRVIADNPSVTGTNNGVDLTLILGPEDVTGALADPGNTLITVSWTNPSSCFDEILVVGNAGGSVTATPFGNGSAYTANSAFGSGTDLGGNQYAVYKGSSTSDVITGLTNGTNYCFKIFTRKGSNWSNGIEVCATPDNPTALAKGDLAILAVNGNDFSCSSVTAEDVISFVCFTDITPTTTIHFTDNGYERCNAGEFGNTEGTIEMKRTGTTIPAGTIITIKADNSGNYSATVPDGDWTFTEINFSGNFNLNNGGDQIWFMQGGTWQEGTWTSHDANYKGGNVLFGFSSNPTFPWVASCTTNPTQRSNMYPIMDCFSMSPTGTSDWNKYIGPLTATNKRNWIARIGETTNWKSYANCSDFNTQDILPATISIAAGGFVDGKWVGDKDTDWFDCLNWEGLAVPRDSTVVLIPSTGVTFEPNISVTGAECFSLENQAGRTLTIDGTGTLTVKENFQNDASFLHTAGSVTFYSSENTIISGTANIPFYDLIINKTPGANVSLSQAVEATNTLTLTSGVVSTGFYRLTLSNTAAASLIAYGNTSFVNGVFRRHFASNTDTYIYPVGIGTSPTDYYRADILNSNLSGNSFSYLDIEANAFIESFNNIDANIIATQDGTSIIDIREDAFWTLTPDNEPSSGTYGVRLYTANISALTDNKFCPLKRSITNHYNEWSTFESTTTIPAAGTAGRTIASGYAERLGYADFSEHAVGVGNNILPIELLNFSVQSNNNQVKVKWQTVTEINNDYFEVERSKNGIDFYLIGTVQGAGNSLELLHYTLIDNYPLEGIAYYRLRQVDFDGQFSFSNIEMVNHANTSPFTAFPNPSHNGNIKLTFTHANSIRELKVRNALGETIALKTLSDNQIQEELILNTGVYFVSVSSQNESFTRKLIVY